ncbi:hypothetical protein PQO01_01830 [Lentisphaera marina]|uniref:hypothetical protein n=1 Tax=Lentisphaera marina TaxID=1111041 RepID=UPI002365C63A|nr:hypothetical protein [Lentisphaera marina]MDD7983688.1 hypothetical protein [Lentisphaera marina]
MKVNLFILCFSLSFLVMGQWPEAKTIKIIHSADASKSELKLCEQMAAFFSQGNNSLAEDMLISDVYAKKFFTYYTNNFLLIVGKKNLLMDVSKQGVKLNSPSKSYTEQGLYTGAISYLGLSPNPLFLKARYLGIRKGLPNQSLIVYGEDLKALKIAFQKIQMGYVQGTWTLDEEQESELPEGKEHLWGMAFESDNENNKSSKPLLRKYVWDKSSFLSELIGSD